MQWWTTRQMEILDPVLLCKLIKQNFSHHVDSQYACIKHYIVYLSGNRLLLQTIH